jgi:hypothetical protein
LHKNKHTITLARSHTLSKEYTNAHLRIKNIHGIHLARVQAGHRSDSQYGRSDGGVPCVLQGNLRSTACQGMFVGVFLLPSW